jgi:hypothetical protein
MATVIDLLAANAKTYASLGRYGGSLKLLRPSSRVRAVLRVVRLLDPSLTFAYSTHP